MRPNPIDDSAMQSHLVRLNCQGYTILRNAIAPDVLAEARERALRLIETHGELPTAANPKTVSRDVNRLWEVDPFFEQFMDLPGVFDVAKAYMKDDITLLAGAIANYVPPHSGSRVAWHRDGPYVRATFLLSNVTEQRGPTAVYPGSHRMEDRQPDWFNDGESPRDVDGQVKIIGRAGDCMVNDTMIWHTSTPNRDDEPRLLIWVVYKLSAQPVTNFENLRNTQGWIDGLTDARRRALVAAAAGG